MELTPFGEIILPDHLKGPDIEFIAKFDRYDDGWRLDKDSSTPVVLGGFQYKKLLTNRP